MCEVCRALAHDPVQTNCCGKTYCAQCLKTEETSSCPACGSTEQSDPSFAVFRDRNAQQHITSLLVYCPNDGCSTKINLSKVKDHLDGCAFQVVSCSNECGHSAWRECIAKHMPECPLRQDQCQYCPFISTHENVTGAHLEECPNNPHQQVECEYKQFGCAVVLRRKDVAEHLKTSMESHLLLTKKRVEEQEMQVEGKARQLLETYLQKVQELNTRLEEMEATVSNLSDRMQQYTQQYIS